MTPSVMMRLAPSNTGSSIFPDKCNQPQNMTYIVANEMMTGVRAVATVPVIVDT